MEDIYKHALVKVAQLNCVGYLKQYSVEAISGARLSHVSENKLWDIKFYVFQSLV